MLVQAWQKRDSLSIKSLIPAVISGRLVTEY